MATNMPSRSLWVPKTSSMSCARVGLVCEATDPRLFPDPVIVEIVLFGYRFQRRGAVQGAVWPVLIVVRLVGVQDPPQMGLVPDETSQGLRCQAARGSVYATAPGQAVAELAEGGVVAEPAGALLVVVAAGSG